MRCNSFSQYGSRLVSLFVVALFASGLVESVQAVSLSYYSSQVLTTNPVLYWGLDETSGTTAGDLSSINGSNTGTYINSTLGSAGPRPVDGFLGMNDDNRGPAVAASGKAQILNLETTGLVGTAAYSAQIWFNSSQDFGDQVLNYMMERGIDTTTGRRDGIGVGGSWGGGTVDSVLFAVDGSGSGVSNGTTVLSPDTWYHLVMVRDDSLGSERLKLYLNGNTTPELVRDDPWFGGTGDVFAAGNRTDGNLTLGLTGTFDEFAVWDYALTPTQVEALYNASLIQVPEPSTLSLLGLGVFGLLRHTRRKNYLACRS